MAQNPNAPGTKKLMLILSGGAGLVLLGGGGLLVGLNSELANRQTLAGQKEAEVGSSEQIAKRFQTTMDDYNDTQSRIKFLESSVSPKSYVPTLLGQLQSLAASTHLTMTSVRPATPPPAPPPAAKPAAADGSAPLDAKKAAPPPYDTLDVDVEVTGTYADTATFLYDLTRFPKIISVLGAQMHPASSAPAAGAVPAAPQVTTSLKLAAFMFHDDAAPEAPGGPAVTLTAASTPAPDLMGRADVMPISAAAGRAERGAVSAVRASNDRITAGANINNGAM